MNAFLVCSAMDDFVSGLLQNVSGSVGDLLGAGLPQEEAELDEGVLEQRRRHRVAPARVRVAQLSRLLTCAQERKA